MKRFLSLLLAAMLAASLAPGPVLAAAPDASPATASTDEDTAVSVTLSASDPDSDPIVSFDVVVGSEVKGETGSPSAPDCSQLPVCTATVTFTPDADVNGTGSFEFTATDGTETSAPATATITITAVNDPPTFTKGANQTDNEDAGAQIVAGWATSISPGPADEAGQTVSFTVANDNTALFSVQPALAANGTLTYTPAANQNGSATVSVYATDTGGTGNGGVNQSAIQTFTITVNPVNDVPSFTKGGNQTVAEDPGPQSASGWATAISAGPANESGQALTFEIASNTNPGLFAAGPAVAANGTLTYTPALNANGTATVGVRLKDDGGTANGGVDTSATQTFSITVTPVNDNPTAVNDTLTVAEDSGPTSGINVLGNDSSAPDGGEQLSVTAVGGASHGSATLHPQQGVRYAPTANYNGPDAFTYTISDGNGGTATATVNVTVTPVNDNPVAVNDTATVAEDSVDNTINVLANDTMGPDTGETLSVSAVGAAAHGTTSLVAGVVHYVPAASYSGADSFTYTLSDGIGGTATGTVSVTVTPVNDNPTAVNDTAAVLEDSGATSITVLGNDSIAPDTGETLTVTGVTQPAHGTASFTATNVSYTPAADYNGPDAFTYSISDGNGGTATATVNMTITAVNDAPSFTKGANDTVLEDAGAQTFAGWATGISPGPADEAAQTVSFTVTNDNNGLFSVQPAVAANGTLTYTPATNAFGSAIVSVRAQDTGGTANGGVNQSGIQTFTITITAVNDAPSFNKGANQTDLEDAGPQSVAGWATAISKGATNEGGQVLTFEVTDNTNVALFSVQPAVDPTTGTLTYTPAANASGGATIALRLTDNGGTANGGDDTSATQTFTITVTAVNDAPSFTKGADQADLEDAGAQTVAGWATAISPGPADESGQTVSFEVASNTNTALFSVQPAVAVNGTLTYTPAGNQSGTATIGVRIKDNGGIANAGTDTSATQTFAITVTPVNDAPSFTKGADQADLEDAGAQTIAGWATAISAGPSEAGQTVTFNVTNTNTALFSAQPAVASNGTLTYTPATNANGSATVSVRAVDTGGTADGGTDQSAIQTFTITVTAVNDAPSFTKGVDQTDLEDAGAQSVPAWATAISPGPADEGAQTVSFIVTNTNTALFSAQPAVASNGTLTYTPAADANGAATVSVRLGDSGGTANGGVSQSANQTFTITVTAVNDPPSFIKGTDQEAPEDAALQSVPGWATAISAGAADEAGQVLTFEITANDNPTLFAVQPAIDAATGTLTYDPATNRTGTATVSARLKDDGGTANGGADTSATETFTITVAGANDPPIAANDIATVRLAGPTAIDVRANDSGGPNEGGDSYLITSVEEGARGIVTITGGGTGLTYDPIGCATGTDTIHYTLTDGGGLTDAATVLVTVANPSSYPVADGPRPLFVTNSTIGSTVPVKITWCGLTSGTTIRSYRLYESKNSGSLSTKISSTTATSSTRSLSVSPTTYLYRVKVVDNKGRTAYGTGPRFKVGRYQESNTAIVYSTGWSTSKSSSYSGGAVRYTKSAGKSATFTYTGRSFGIVGTRGSTRGSFHVYVDGVRVTSTAVSTRASKTQYRRVLYQRSLAFGTHTVKIVAVGNGRIDLDAIITIAGA